MLPKRIALPAFFLFLMNLWHRFTSRLCVFFRREKLDAEMAEEMRAHLERRMEALISEGRTPEEARYAAQRSFGGMDQLKEVAREQRGSQWLEDIVRAVRLSGRRMAKDPGFTATALGVLTLCLAANLTLFAIIDSTLLRPLPFPNDGRLVTIFNTYPHAGVERDGASLTNYYERRGQIDAFRDIAIFRPDSAIIGEAGATARLETARISPEFFRTLGVNPILGRGFSEEETTKGSDDVAILTDGYWRRHFGGSSDVLGHEVRVDGVARKIVGVLPPGFRFLSSEASLFFPYASEGSARGAAQRHSGDLITMIGRLKPGVSAKEAEAQIARHDAALAESYPQAKMIADAGFRTVVALLHDDHVKSVRQTLWLLQGGAFLLLLIGSFNLVNLLLVRASGRSREIAIRQSLGAMRKHIVMETAVETAVLTSLGGVAGLAVARVAILLVGAFGGDRLPLNGEISVDSLFVVCALLGAVALGLAIAFPLAWFNLRKPLGADLRGGARGGTASRAVQGLRHGFIVLQIALAFVLLAGAGLLGLSLRRAMAVSPGFRADRVLVGHLTLPAQHYRGSGYLAFVEKLTAEIGRQPGVIATSVSTKLPVTGSPVPSGRMAVTVKGHVPQPGQTVRAHFTYGVMGDYLGAMGIPLRQGRFPGADDVRSKTRVCAIDDEFARRYWPEGGALGRQLFLGSHEGTEAEALTVVGIVGVVKQDELTDPEALGTVYVPLSQRPELGFYVVTRTDLPVETFAPTLRAILRGIDPDLPLTDLQPMERRIENSLAGRRVPTLLTAVFAGVALVLSSVGTYGVLAYTVNQSRREIGIRMALGAQPARIGRQFLFLGGRLLAVGATVGAAGAWLLGRTLQSLLFEVPALPVGMLAVTAAIMTAVSLLACWLPARRAARVNPMIALRCE
jgi:predicted permease